MNLSWIDWTIVGALLVLMVGMVLVSKRLVRSVSDFLAANYILALSKRNRSLAPVLAFAIDIFGYVILATLVLDRNILGAISFALGTSLGTWIAMGKKQCL